MEEREWVKSSYPKAMLEFLANFGNPHLGAAGSFQPSDRKVCLFACAWWRHIIPHYSYHEDAALKIEATGDDDGLSALDILHECYSHVSSPSHVMPWFARIGADLIRCIVGNPFRPAVPPPFVHKRDGPAPVCGMCNSSGIHCVLVNRTVSLPVCGFCGNGQNHVSHRRLMQVLNLWRDGVVPRMAERIYLERDWSALPVLADMLEDAGVTNQAWFAHLRGPGPHTRGCHIVDVLLGKE